MDEDKLSPQMGRLIDEAKSAARRAAAATPRAEGVALLADGGSVYSGYRGADGASPLLCAAEVALASARRAGEDKILAAAVAVVDDPAETILPTPASHRCLADLDPDLPLVFKQRGRWVLLLLSQLPPAT